MKLFELEEEQVSQKYFLLLIVIAYAFSIAIRMIWVAQFGDYEPFHWNNQLMINTNDGYYFASWVQAIVDGSHQFNPRVEDNIFKYAVVMVTVFAVKLGFSIDTATLYMPAIISSLVVIPILLIARLYKLTLLGFFAALLGSITWSYYNRTMVGYYDTDMFSAMAPMFIIYFLVKLIEQNSMKNLLFAAAMLAIYPFLYDQGLAVVYAMGIITMLYMLLFHREDSFTYKSIILLSIALMPFAFLIKVGVFVVAFGLFTKAEIDKKVLMILALLSFFSFLFLGNVFGLILAKIAGYTLRGTESEGLHFFGVNQTVREAGRIPFETMANRISGSTFGLIAAFVGYILLLIKHRSFIVSLPLIGIGVFSLWGGLRFTVYAVPVAAIGAIYLVYIITNVIEKKRLRYVAIVAMSALFIYPNITHIIAYKVPTVFTKNEVAQLDKLKSIASPKDYTIAWWDYGYPIWYYSDTNTLIDGGKHNNDNFIVSKILMSTSQQQAANLARLSIESYVSSGYKVVADTIFNDKDGKRVDPNILLDELLLADYPLPQKSRDIYFYLPSRMLNIVPTIKLFSNIDLTTGEKLSHPFFFQTSRFKQSGDEINLGSGVRLKLSSGVVKIGDSELKVNSFFVTLYDKSGKLQVQKQTIDRNSNINVIFMKNYNKFIILDNEMLESSYIQMFVFEQYDHSLFEAVVLDPQVKIYKLKR